MAFATYKPSPPLSQFVDYVWWLSDSPTHTQERIVPTGTQELVFNLCHDAFDIRGDGHGRGGRRFSGALVSGAYDKYFVIDTRAHANIVGVHFKPGGARSILGVPLGQLANEHADLELLWGTPARALRERLGEAAGTQQRFRLVEKQLLERLAPHSGANRVVAAAIQRLVHQHRAVTEVAGELGISCRRFIELFTAEVGMTPKLYARVQRFQGALACARTATPDWAELALRCGYCDQSHLIREFVSFSGFSPTEALRHGHPQLKEHHLAHDGKIHPRHR